MTVDLDSLVRRPFRSTEWSHTHLVGALLVATAPLVIPVVLLAGYGIRVLRIGGDEPLPTFADLRSLAETGVRATVVGLTYHLPGLVLVVGGGLTAASAFPTGGTPWTTPPQTFAAAPAVTGVAGLRAALSGAVAVAGAATLPFSSYLSLVAITEYAITDDVAAAFEAGRIRERALSTATLRAWLLAAVVGGGSWIVAVVVRGVGTNVPGVGGVVAGGVLFYGGVLALLVWNAFRPSVESADREEAPSASPATAT